MILKDYKHSFVIERLFFLLILCNFAFKVQAQIQDDPCFEAGNGALAFNDAVRCSAVQADGKILMGGSFLIYNEADHKAITRFNSDGSVDHSFNIGSGFSVAGGVVTVYAIEIQTDGKILVGGYITNFNGTPCYRIVRLNSDGSLDTTFTSTGTGFDGNVYSIAVQADGKIVVVGNFQNYNGVSQRHIARLNADGSLDTTFAVGTGFNGDAYSLKIQADGKILVGGNFTSYNGAFQSCIVRLNNNGTRDALFITYLNSNFGVNIRSIVIQADGKILIGGRFTSYNSTSLRRIARLNIDGSLDNSFVVGTGFNDVVYNIAVQDDGKVLVGGEFTDYGGVVQNCLTRLDSTGSRDTTFNIGSGVYAYNSPVVYTIALQTDGRILVGGDYSSFDGIKQYYASCLNSNGSLSSIFNIHTGLNELVKTVAVQTDGKILVGGFFTTYNGISQNHLIRLNDDGNPDTSFNIGTGFAGPASYVDAVKVQADGKILVGGRFDNYNGTSQSNLVRLNDDGSLDASFNIGTGFAGGISYVDVVRIQADGKILVGGDFYGFNGISQNRIVRLNADGSRDSSFNVGTGFKHLSAGYVSAITLQLDGKILVGGLYTYYNDSTHNCIVRLNSDGSLDNSFVTGTGFDNLFNSIEAIAVESNGRILVGGSFSSYNDTLQSCITRLENNGSIDLSFASGIGFNSTAVVNSFIVESSGKILVGGRFNSYDGAFNSGIIRLNTNGTKEASFNTGTGFFMHENPGSLPSVEELALQADGKILVVGGFRAYNNIGKSFIARLGGSYADINLQGNSNNIISGQTSISANDLTDFGAVVECGGIVTQNFVIQNVGDQNLNINSISSSHPDFVISNIPGIIVAGSFDIFMVSFDPSVVGTIQSTITIDNEDCDESLFIYSIQGIGTDLAEVSSNSSNCLASNGIATSTIIGGTAPFSFVWSNGATDSIATGLTAGIYSVTVADGTGCFSVISDTISSFVDTILTTASFTNVTCLASNGIATVTGAGGTSPYSFLWSNGATTATVIGLIAGNYNVTITDINGCNDSTSMIVGTYLDTILTSTFSTDATCLASNGTATVTGAGGTSPYSFLWSNGMTNGTATGLISGNYNVTITDVNGCNDSTSMIVGTYTDTILTSNSSTNAICLASNGTATVTGAGGTSPYSFLWSNGTTNGIATGLISGVYNATITDNNGCTNTISATVGDTSNSIVATTLNTDISCNGLNDGSISLFIGGGITIANYNWSNGATTSMITGLSGGLYFVTVTDSNGCSGITFSPIIEPATLFLTTTIADASGIGLSDGSIDLQVSGGISPYVFHWSNGASTEDISGLSTGSYDVTVTDANGCTLSNSGSIQVGQLLMEHNIQSNDLVADLYPNPTHEGVYLEMKGFGELRVELIDLNGCLLQVQKNSSQVIYIEMSEYAAGMYFVRLYKNKKQQSLKVIKH